MTECAEGFGASRGFQYRGEMRGPLVADETLREFHKKYLTGGSREVIIYLENRFGSPKGGRTEAKASRLCGVVNPRRGPIIFSETGFI